LVSHKLVPGLRDGVFRMPYRLVTNGYVICLSRALGL